MIPDVPKLVTAVGGLGTASFGLVDAFKAVFSGINRMGLAGIHDAVTALTPDAPPQQKIHETLEANWINGTDLSSQKSIAKSLIKLNLNAANAPKLAAATGVDPDVLTNVATKIATGNAPGNALKPNESDVYQRFDFAVTSLLDEAYQRSDQVYRNQTRALAMLVSISLAFAGGVILHDVKETNFWDWAKNFFGSRDFWESLIVGVLATPLAPVAKDLSTALAAAVNTLQLVKK